MDTVTKDELAHLKGWRGLLRSLIYRLVMGVSLVCSLWLIVAFLFVGARGWEEIWMQKTGLGSFSVFLLFIMLPAMVGVISMGFVFLLQRRWPYVDM